jgi:hypothetical protein
MNRSFLRAQLRYMMQTFPTRKGLRRKAWIAVDACMLLAGYARLRAAMARPAPRRSRAEQRCVVVLLSHNRPQNMPIIVRCALKNPWVSKLIVSNSNSKLRIAEWIDSRDERLVLIDESRPTQPGHRFTLAAESGGEYCLSIDDDIFLAPRQWTALFENLLADDSVPHGITGNMFIPDSISGNGSPFHHVSRVEQEVDVLIGAYAFARKHLDRMFALAGTLGIGRMSDLRNGEDVLLSFAGEGRPRIHALGPFLTCASESAPGVALWQSHDNFWDERDGLFQRARTARLAMDAPWNGPRVLKTIVTPGLSDD